MHNIITNTFIKQFCTTAATQWHLNELIREFELLN